MFAVINPCDFKNFLGVKCNITNIQETCLLYSNSLPYKGEEYVIDTVKLFFNLLETFSMAKWD
jgi:hypothetical protein